MAAPDRWISLASGFSPQPFAPDLGFTGVPPGVSVTADEDAGGWWVETGIPADAWEPGRRSGEWKTANPLAFLAETADRNEVRLREGDRAFARVLSLPNRLDPGRFHLAEGRMNVCTGSDYAPANEMTIAALVHMGGAEEGVWRVSFGQETADAVCVWPGRAEELTVDLPPGSILRFGTAFRSIDGDASGPEAEVRFRVHLDGQVVFDDVKSPSSPASTTWHEVALPRSRGASRRIGFSVEGPFGVGIFVNPRIGPGDKGSYSSRPWGGSRPNVIVFLADTFRADSLAMYGGTAGKTPNLDRLAAESFCLLRAWAPATWTLPSQASMMTGLYPQQHGADSYEAAMPRQLTTIAEQFAKYGYRTGAATDSALVSAAYGFDQGFEWFCETDDWSLRGTFETALDFLDRDDGRPVFLFVQTYRTHMPYRQGATEDATAWNELTSRALRSLRQQGGEQAHPLEHLDALLPEYVGEYRELYDDGVRALDEELGRWIGAVKERDVLDTGYLVFTSDHGEAFGEHGEYGHRGSPWCEGIDVPLLIHGGSLEPARVSHPASLLDVPKTLADLAGIAPAPEWRGCSLLRLEAERTLFAVNRTGQEACISILDGSRKVLVSIDLDDLESSETIGIYDVEEDPFETRDLSDITGGVDAREWRRWATTLEPLLEPVAQAVSVELDEEARARLAAIGYGDD